MTTTRLLWKRFSQFILSLSAYKAFVLRTSPRQNIIMFCLSQCDEEKSVLLFNFYFPAHWWGKRSFYICICHFYLLVFSSNFSIYIFIIFLFELWNILCTLDIDILSAILGTDMFLRLNAGFLNFVFLPLEILIKIFFVI